MLGPRLFISYVNDLQGFDGGMVCQYADDTSVLLAGQFSASLSAFSSNAIAGMSQWCTQNALKLNINKTNLPVFSKTKNNFESLFVNLKNIFVPVAESVRFLGLTINPGLS